MRSSKEIRHVCVCGGCACGDVTIEVADVLRSEGKVLVRKTQ